MEGAEVACVGESVEWGTGCGCHVSCVMDVPFKMSGLLLK